MLKGMIPVRDIFLLHKFYKLLKLQPCSCLDPLVGSAMGSLTCPAKGQCPTSAFGTRENGRNICLTGFSEDELRSRIFGTFVVKFFACVPLLGFLNL